METLALGLVSGALVGLILALIGGGGAILVVPMLAYLAGVSSLRVAIGTSSVADLGVQHPFNVFFRLP